MSTKIYDSTSIAARRSVEILLEDPEGLSHGPVSVAQVSSRSYTETGSSSELLRPPLLRPPRGTGRWTPPALHFNRSDGQEANFTRAQWETLKREVDEAFSLFEATWPADRIGPADLYIYNALVKRQGDDGEGEAP